MSKSGEHETAAVKLRPPRVDELATLSRLCLRSKAVHGYGAPMMAAFRQELLISREDLEVDAIAVAQTEDGVVGVAQVSHTEDGCYLEKLFIEPDAMGQGYGSLLFEWAVKAARAGGASEMIIESDPGAAKFYRSMGAKPAGIAPSGSVFGRTLPRLVVPLG